MKLIIACLIGLFISAAAIGIGMDYGRASFIIPGVAGIFFFALCLIPLCIKEFDK